MNLLLNMLNVQTKPCKFGIDFSCKFGVEFKYPLACRAAL